MIASALPTSVDAMLDLLTSRGYLAERSLATVTYLSLRMGRPLFLEGEAGVGKTEIAKVLSSTLGRRLIRLQCYEGLDVAAAVYEWNYAAQMIAIRLAEAEGGVDRDRRLVLLRTAHQYRLDDLTPARSFRTNPRRTKHERLTRESKFHGRPLPLLDLETNK